MHQKDKLTINFTGDISFTGCYKDAVIQDKEIFEDSILSVFKEANYNVINLEGPSTDKKNHYRNNGLVVSPYKSIDYLTKRNISIFNLANNHLFDNGIEGYNDTVTAITENNGLKFGGGLNIEEAKAEVSLNKHGISIAMIGVCHKEGMIANKTNPGVFCIKHNFSAIKAIAKRLKKTHDWVIINYHGGEEYSQIPMPSRKKLLRKLSKTDADIIVAHHSHVFQGYELYNKKPIFYSLGNFVFDIPNHKTVNFAEQSAILSFMFSKTEFMFSFKPTLICTKTGMIKEGPKEFLNTIESLGEKTTKNYYKNWLKDAHRTFFNAHKTIKKTETNTVGKRHQSLTSLLFQKDTFIKFYNLLKSENKRPLFIGALIHKILR